MLTNTLWRVAALVVLLVGATLHPAPEAEAREGACPRGTHRVSTAVKSHGSKIAGFYKRAQSRCVTNEVIKRLENKPNDESSILNQPDTTNSLAGCRILGVTPEERANGALRINGNRWAECPRGMTLIRVDNAAQVVDVGSIARSLAVQLRLPDTTPIFSPDPKKNEWGMLAVGFPVWLTTQGPRAKSTSASSQGLTFRLSATWRSTTFSMGDGSSVSCTAMTAYSASVKAGSPSPTCGHAYTKPSLPKGAYTVTATANWVVNWSVDGFSGSFPMSYSDSAQLRIGELQALNR